MGILDQPLTLKLVIKIIFSVLPVITVIKSIAILYFLIAEFKEYKRAFTRFIILLINAVFLYWLWS